MIRSRHLDAIITAVSTAASGDAAEAVSLMVGALTLMCAKSRDPISVLQICIDSLTRARDLCVEHAERKFS